MPLDSMMYIAFVVAVFTQFAVVLAYADWATRHANDDRPPFRKFARAQEPKQREETAPLSKAA
jgi:hypothetical protein